MEKTKLLILRITERCNLACAYCYAAAGGLMGDMGIDTAKKAVSLFAAKGEKLNVQFTGGEPLLHAGLMRDIFEHTKREGILASFSIQTNGTLLNSENCALLREMRCAVGVSLDGIGKANCLRIYPDGTYAIGDAIAGIRLLAGFGLRCNLNAVVTSANQHELPGLVELAAYLGSVGGIGLDMFRPMGRGAYGSFEPDIDTLPVDIASMLEKRAELERLGVNIRIKEQDKTRFMLKNGIDEKCYCAAQTRSSAVVDYRGDFYPCSSLAGIPEMRMGNTESGIGTPPQILCKLDGDCLGCSELPLCRGGCPAGRVVLAGKNARDCVMHRSIIAYGRNEIV